MERAFAPNTIREIAVMRTATLPTTAGFVNPLRTRGRTTCDLRVHWLLSLMSQARRLSPGALGVSLIRGCRRRLLCTRSLRRFPRTQAPPPPIRGRNQLRFCLMFLITLNLLLAEISDQHLVRKLEAPHALLFLGIRGGLLHSVLNQGPTVSQRPYLPRGTRLFR